MITPSGNPRQGGTALWGHQRQPKPPIDCAEALKRSALLPSGRTSSVVCPSIRILHFTLIARPVGRPPHEVRRSFASFGYQAQSWNKSRRVVPKVDGRAVPTRRLHRHQPGAAGRARGGLLQPARHLRAVHEGGKSAVNWTRLSCRTFAANAVRLQLHVLAYNLGNSATSCGPGNVQAGAAVVTDQPAEKLVKIGAKIVSHGRYVTFQMAEVGVSRQMFQGTSR
jgi:hypothetical protein